MQSIGILQNHFSSVQMFVVKKAKLEGRQFLEKEKRFHPEMFTQLRLMERETRHNFSVHYAEFPRVKPQRKRSRQCLLSEGL